MTNPNQFPYQPNYYSQEGYDPAAFNTRKKRRQKRLVGAAAATLAAVSGVFGINMLNLNGDNAAATIHSSETSSEASVSELTEEETTEQAIPQLETEYPMLTSETTQIDLSDVDSIADAPEELVEIMSRGLTAGATNENLETWLDLEESERPGFVAAIADQNIQEIAEGIFGADEGTTINNSQAFFDSLKPYYVHALTETFEREEGHAYTQYEAGFTYITTRDADNLDKIVPATIELRFSDNGEYSDGDELDLEFDTNAWAVDEEGKVVYTLPHPESTARFYEAGALTAASDETSEVPAV